MRPARYSAILLLAALGGCVAGFTVVQPGVNTFGPMRVTADENWNKAPSAFTPLARSQSRTWTQDGLLLDRLVIIPKVADGEPIFNSRDQSAALPVFRADMLPNEIEELVESSIVKLYGEGQSAVSTSNLRPQGFGEYGGLMFDFAASITESPDYRGLVGAFIVDDELYMVIFLAADPYYYDKYAARADAIIKSATLSSRTVGRF
jgi:hypothetical protein